MSISMKWGNTCTVMTDLYNFSEAVAGILHGRICLRIFFDCELWKNWILHEQSKQILKQFTFLSHLGGYALVITFLF